MRDRSKSAVLSDEKQWYNSCNEEEVWHAVWEVFLIPLRGHLLPREVVRCWVDDGAEFIVMVSISRDGD